MTKPPLQDNEPTTPRPISLTWLYIILTLLAIFMALSGIGINIDILKGVFRIEPPPQENTGYRPPEVTVHKNTVDKNLIILSEVSENIESLKFEYQRTSEYSRSLDRDTTLNNLQILIRQLKSIETDMHSENTTVVEKAVYDYNYLKNKVYEYLQKS